MRPGNRFFVLALLGAVSALAVSPAGVSAQQATAADAASQQSNELNSLVDDAIRITSRRYLTANVHTPWQILHGILALRQDFQIKVDGKKTSALEWLASGQSWTGQSIVEATAYGGQFHPYTQPYHFEGHPNQFLAIVTMSELPQDFGFKTVQGSTVTIKDMIQNAKAGVNDREEITWTLWSLARYIPVNSQWHSKEGEAWSMERLLQIQTNADPNDAACGGTHGLFAMSVARNAYVFSGRSLRGVWLEADQKIKRYIQTARATQNPDGTFSANYFMGPGHSREFSKRLASSGHILEFLMVAVTDEELQQDWMQRGVRAVAKDLVDHRRDPADCGPLYHALHALVLYRQRLGFEPTEKKDTVAGKTNEKVATGETVDGASPQESRSDTTPEPAETDVESNDPIESTDSPSGVTNEESSDSEGASTETPAEEAPEKTDDSVRDLFEGPFQPTKKDEAVDTESNAAAFEKPVSRPRPVTTDVFFNEAALDSLQFQAPVRITVRDMEENAVQTRPALLDSSSDAVMPPTED